MSINGKVEEGSMEIDTANNMERFSTGSGADEAVEVHDFEIVSSGQRNQMKYIYMYIYVNVYQEAV